MKSILKLILYNYLATILLPCQQVYAYRILSVIHNPSFSHFIPAIPIFQSLLEHGHELVIIAPYSFPVDDQYSKNVSFIEIKELRSIDQEILQSDFLWETVTLFNTFQYMIKYHLMDYEKWQILNEKLNFAQLLSDKFDAVFVEDMGDTPFYLLADHFECPYIGFSANSRNPEGRLGNFQHMILHPSTDEFETLFGYDGAKSFTDRFFCLIHEFTKLLQYKFSIQNHFSANFREILFGPAILASIWPRKYTPDLHIQAVHPAFGFQRPMLHKTVQVGFTHIRPIQPLPTELENYLESSKNGVIYVTFGTNLFSRMNLNPDCFNITILNQALSRIDFDVLWKWDGEMVGKPKNVRLAKWIPQQDLIAHEKVKLVICHGGLQTIAEAITHQTPILSIPFVWDHQANSEKIRDLGVGRMILRKDMNESILIEAINDLITNQSYKTELEELSAVFQDTQLPPAEAAVQEIEWTTRFKGKVYKNPNWTPWFPSKPAAHLEVGLTVIFSTLIAIIIFATGAWRIFTARKNGLKFRLPTRLFRVR